MYSSPPPLRTFRDDKATLLVCWWCTIFAAVIIIFRVCGRYIRTERLFREDWLALGCMIPLFSRMALVHVILLFGTNNVFVEEGDLSERGLRRRIIGSKLVLVSRIFYAATLWMLKLTISEFFKRLISNIWRRSYEITLICIRWFLLVTFIAVVIADLAECRPTTGYWQVIPDPGPRCRMGYAQLITMGTADVITDFLLVVFPIVIIVGSTMNVKRKVQLTLLFAGSLLPAGTTLFRIPNIIDRHGSQQYRSLLASIEILFATAVANALVLGSFVRDKGVKKQRWKFGSLSDSIERTSSRRGTAVMRHWGSDEDLVRGLGIGVDPELRSEELSPRPAPMATSGTVPVKAHKVMGGGEDHVHNKGVSGKEWQFPSKLSASDTSDEFDVIKVAEGDQSPGEVSSILSSPRKVSFFDVGGLLENDKQFRRVSSTRTVESGESSSQGGGNAGNGIHSQWAQDGNNFAGGLSPAPPRRGSTALLQDIGGLLSPRSVPLTSRNGSNSVTPGGGGVSRSYELQKILREEPPPGILKREDREGSKASQGGQSLARQSTHNSLQDVGGLLK